MKAHNLIASVAAILLTTASLGVVNYNVEGQPAATQQHDAAHVTNLAPVQVYPSAAEMRAAALLPADGTATLITLPSLNRIDGASTPQFSLLGSELVMPYYSFGNKFGRVSKE